MAAKTKAEKEAAAKLAAEKKAKKAEEVAAAKAKAEADKANKPEMFKHIITQEDLDANPSLIGEVEVGEEIEIPVNEPTPEDITRLVEEGVIETRANTGSGNQKPLVTPPAGSDDDVEEEVETTGGPDRTQPMFYRKALVQDCTNRLVNGRLYVEIKCPDTSYLLSTEEFNSEVRN